ncbi:MAG: HPr family phosphocarrier protein [Eubacteriales bacterium]|nr:HPr family phosphocarrier protein [Sarcina sp.]MBR2729065.1 HPr family phosphocarrier protein [Lachnospiraceae bacterium]MDO4416664.1 HPr family phosphocarrier protein [Eubacteriales bacterium]
MKEIKFKVTDPLGIHARPAGILVKDAKKFNSKITVWKGDKSCDLRKLLALMGLSVRQNDEIVVQVEGDDEAACAEMIEKYLKENF